MTTSFSFPWSIAIVVVDGDDGVVLAAVVLGGGEAADMGRTVATGQTPT